MGSGIAGTGGARRGQLAREVLYGFETGDELPHTGPGSGVRAKTEVPSKIDQGSDSTHCEPGSR